jgi:uncharacterized protein YjbI with pentapeptide repeats
MATGLLFRKEGGDDETAKRTFTSIKRANFLNVVFADFEQQAFFVGAEARETTFGYSEGLEARRARHTATYKATGKPAAIEDGGALFGFHGNNGGFQKTKWLNLDFGGQNPEAESYLEQACFDGADFSEAVFEGCDLSYIDFSTAKIKNIQMINPVNLRGLIIAEDQIEDLAGAIKFTDGRRSAWEAEMKKNNFRELLEQGLGIIIQ